MFLSFLFIFFQSIVLQGGSISASIDPETGSKDDLFELNVVIEGDIDEDPQLNSNDDFVVQSTGKSQSITMLNFKTSRKIIFTYTISPQKNGIITIPPISAKIDGKVESTKEIKFRVGSSANPGKDTGEEQQDETPSVFLERTVEKNDVYVNEPVITHTKLFFRNNIKSAGELNEKLPAELRKLGLNLKRQYSENIDGVNYGVVEFTEAYQPLKAGTLNLPSAEISVQMQVISQSRGQNRRRRGGGFDDFFDHPFFNGPTARLIEKKIKSSDISVRVKDLPKEGRPSNFSGLVGQFELTGSLSADKTQLGESVTATLKISGYGISDVWDTPSFDESTFKIYPDKPTASVELDKSTNKLKSSKTFKIALVPKKAGSINLAPVIINVFNPISKKYEYLKANLGTLQVLDNPEEHTKNAPLATAAPLNDPTKRKIEQIGSDIIGIKSSVAQFSSKYPSSQMKAIMWVLFFCALLVIIGRLYLVFLSEKFSHKLRRKTQIKKLRQNLEKSSNNLKETNDVIYKYLETLTGKNLSQKTASELGDYLSTETRISKDKVDTLQKLVGKIEMSLYANSATQDSQKVAQEALDILSEMEKSL